jgi:transcriptional regulator with XRE-family HTH domain
MPVITSPQLSLVTPKRVGPQQAQVVFARGWDAVTLPGTHRWGAEPAESSDCISTAEPLDYLRGETYPFFFQLCRHKLMIEETNTDAIALTSGMVTNIPDMTTTLAERLAQAMREATPPVSQADLARACGIKPPSVHAWLSGKAKDIRGDNAVKAARKLGITVEWLTTGRGPMRPYPAQGAGQVSTVGERRAAMEGTSQYGSVDARILEDAEAWAQIFETASGRPYSRREKTELMSRVYAQISANGGRLSDQSHREYLQELERLIRARGQPDERRSTKAEDDTPA